MIAIIHGTPQHTFILQQVARSPILAAIFQIECRFWAYRHWRILDAAAIAIDRFPFLVAKVNISLDFVSFAKFA